MLFSQYPCPLLFCIVFSWLGMGGGGSRKHRIHFSSRLTLSVEFLRFHVGPVRRTTVLCRRLHSTTTKLHSSSCSVADMSVHSSIFKKRSTSSTKFLLSSFHCFEAVFLSFTLNWRLSPLQLTQIQFLLLRIQPAFL